MRHTRLIVVAAASAIITGSVHPAGAYSRPGAVERVSVSSAGAQGTDSSGYDSSATGNIAFAPVVMTPDGRYVAFVSKATNLVSGDMSLNTEVFVRDRRARKTFVASVSSDGTIGGVTKTASSAGVCGAAQPSIMPTGVTSRSPAAIRTWMGARLTPSGMCLFMISPQGRRRGYQCL